MSTRPDAANELPLVQVLHNTVLRLVKGLGNAVTGVAVYNGELENLSQVLRMFPAAWVTYLGCARAEFTDASKTRQRVYPKFAVMIGTQTARADGKAALTGGHAQREVGAAYLLHMVRYLLAGQTLGLQIKPMQYIGERVIAQQQLDNQGCAVYSIEFQCSWIESHLSDGAWPAHLDTHPSGLFVAYDGKTDQADPDMTAVQLHAGPLSATINLQE